MELKGLKRLQGLDTLLAESKANELTSEERIFNLAVDVLQTGKYQPRTQLDENSLAELAASIKAQGIILPLIVRRMSPDRYEIIAGERRWRAAKLAGLEAIPAIIRDIPDETALAFALIENIQRESLNPIDEALAFARLKEDFFMTHEEISERVGRSRSSVTNLLRLLGLEEEVKRLLKARKFEMGHARALLSLEAKDQLAIAQQIVQNGLSVRETEKRVQKMRQPLSLKIKTSAYESKINGWEKTLERLLSVKVKINLGSQGDGRVVIHIHSPAEIEQLIEALETIKR
jgi:ParB family chromosome partitioning protein